MKRRVVITGMGVVSPIGIGNETFWDALKNGRSGVGRLTFFDTTDYPSQIDAEIKGFNAELYIDKKNIRRMDRFTQFSCAAADMAVRDAGLDKAKLDMDRVGVIVGSGIGGLSTIEEEHTVLKERGARRVSPFLIPRLISNIAPGEIAIRWGFTGPNYSISSACATSNHALGEAWRHGLALDGKGYRLRRVLAQRHHPIPRRRPRLQVDNPHQQAPRLRDFVQRK